MRVVAIDPGGCTGYVEYVAHTQGPLSLAPTHILAKEALEDGRLKIDEIDCRDVNKGFSDMFERMLKFKPDVVIYESFDLWTVAADLTPVKLIALMEWQLRSFYELVEQKPSERSVITDERMKRWGLWSPGKKDANAAMKHLLVWLRKNQN